MNTEKIEDQIFGVADAIKDLDCTMGNIELRLREIIKILESKEVKE